jgi:hypothetical protein
MTICVPHFSPPMSTADAARAEALDLIKRAINDLTTQGHDLTIVMRQCFRASGLLGWDQPQAWFQRELQGYGANDELPWYRQNVRGVQEWRFPDVDEDLTMHVGAWGEPTQAVVTQQVYAGLPTVRAWASGGYRERTGRTHSHYSKSRDQLFTIYETRTFPPAAFVTLLASVEDETFRFASNAYALLQYGNALEDVWRLYRHEVDQRLTDIGLREHLVTIDAGLHSDNAQDWRNVLWSCRDVIHDLAAYLRRDPRPTYLHLPGKGGALSVTASDYINRLGAYMHQLGVTGTRGEYLRAEMERIYASLGKLNDLASSAHSGATLQDARTAALGTYFMLAELAQRTNLQPITEYSKQPPTAAET